MGVAVNQLEAPLFVSVDQALRAAYGCAARVICPTSTIFRDMRQINNRTSAPMSQWEMLAQGGLILQAVRRGIDIGAKLALDAYYTVPSDRKQRAYKDYKCRALAIKLSLDGCDVPAHYLYDVVREWAGARRHHDDTWWAQRLGKSPRTLHRWRAGNPDRDQAGVICLLNALLSAGQHHARARLLDAGVID